MENNSIRKSQLTPQRSTGYDTILSETHLLLFNLKNANN